MGKNPDKKCGLCGKTKKLAKTKCCNRWICDDEGNYVMFSYARNSCSRNHRRYTLCGFHHSEEHEGEWQDCKTCREGFETEMYVYYGTNEYNFEKLPNPPSFEPTRCADCDTIIHLGEGGYSQFKGEYFCMNCSEGSGFDDPTEDTGIRAINRQLMILKPKQPLIDWNNRLSKPYPLKLENVRKDCNAYLIPELDDEEESLAFVYDHYRNFFEEELLSWYLDARAWPELTLENFKEWFDIEFHSFVGDFLDEPIEKEGWEEDWEEADQKVREPESESEKLGNQYRHIGRNDPCPCGSGQKFKKCCLSKVQ